MGTNAHLGWECAAPAVGIAQWGMGWPLSGSWAVSEPRCPRHYWATLEWGKFHIRMAARDFSGSD